MKYLSLTIPGYKIDPDVPGVPTGGLAKGQDIIWVLIEVLLVGIVLFALYTLLRGGLNIITSGGDKQKVEGGRNRVRYAIIGLLLIFLFFFLLNIIGKFFGINLLFFYVGP